MSSLCPSCAHASTDTATHCTECGQALLIDGRLRLRQKLGQGGSSSTFIVQDPQGKQGALKLLHLERLHDWKALEMFERQFQLLKSLDHPGIPKVFEVFELELGGLSRKALYQEYIQGDNLRVSLSEGALRFDEVKARKLLSAMLEILEYLHGHSPPIIHRDIKPSNIILRADGSPVLIDFDTASGQVQEAGRGDNTMVGTAGFVPMEQLAGMTKPASDLYALGMTMVAVLTQREVTTLPMQAMRVQFEPHVNISSSLAALIAAMIEPDIAKRIPSAQAARAMLDGLPPANSRAALQAMRTDLSAASAPHSTFQAPQPRSNQRAAQLNRQTKTPFDDQLRGGFDGQARGQAQRTPASEVKGLRFKRSNQFLWAASAHASSNYGGSWDINTIIGEPRVFPKHGDIQGAWAQKSTRAGVVTLDVAFRPDHPQAQELWVFETYNAGAVFAAATLVDDQWHLIWQQQHQKTSSQAHILKIAIPTGLTGSIWRLWLDTSKRDGYNEIDAVALCLAQDAQQALDTPILGAPFDASYGPTGHDVGQGERLSPAQLNQIDFKKDPRFIWAKDARASSNYGGSWDVKNVRGTPKVFPKHGDISGAWAQHNSGSAGPIEWLKVGFGSEFDAVEIWVLETYNPGYIFAITSAEPDQEVLLWQRDPQPGINEARALMVSLDPPRAISLLTIWLDRSQTPSYNEIDAVAIVGQRRAQPTALVTTAQTGHDKRSSAHASAQVFLDLAKQDATARMLSEERHMERSTAHASSQVFIELAKQDAAALKQRRRRIVKRVSIVAVFMWFIGLLWMLFF